MSEKFDKDSKKATKRNHLNKKSKKQISDEQKFLNKANKLHKNRLREIKEEEFLDDIDYYDGLR